MYIFNKTYNRLMMYIIKVMAQRLSMVHARKDLAEVLNRACYGSEVTVITKHGKDVAAVVPMDRLKPEDLPPKKMPQRVR